MQGQGRPGQKSPGSPAEHTAGEENPSVSPGAGRALHTLPGRLGLGSDPFPPVFSCHFDRLEGMIGEAPLTVRSHFCLGLYYLRRVGHRALSSSPTSSPQFSHSLNTAILLPEPTSLAVSPAGTSFRLCLQVLPLCPFLCQHPIVPASAHMDLEGETRVGLLFSYLC